MKSIKLCEETLPLILKMLSGKHKVKTIKDNLLIFFNKKTFAKVPYGWHFIDVYGSVIWFESIIDVIWG